MRRAHALLFSSAVAGLASTTPACVREGAPVVAAVDIAEVDAGATPLVIAPRPPVSSRSQCTATLRAMPIKTDEGCTLDERISKGNGTLVFPCSGEGELEAVFGEHHFRGAARNGTLHLTLHTELDWDDGCHWETLQSLRGDWARGGRDGGRAPKLVWTYEEHAVSGTGCFASCEARADVEVDELTQ